jgi:hypothetical protein
MIRRALRSLSRAALIEDLLRQPCPACGCPSGQGCDPADPDGEMIRLNRAPELMIHTERAQAAISARLVSRQAVLAQFHAGTAPAALTHR